MRQYTMDSVRILRNNTTDCVGVCNVLDLSRAGRTTLFDACFADSPTSSHQSTLDAKLTPSLENAQVFCSKSAPSLSSQSDHLNSVSFKIPETGGSPRLTRAARR
ncbi:hypothetical protein AcW1_007928 [Taiwanofungus camphoratus]|nr:hypothetical protein AcW1_007928 [Antrodia cinnamomea]